MSLRTPHPVTRARCGSTHCRRVHLGPLIGSLLIGLALTGGCGLPSPESGFVEMPDGTELAYDIWLPRDIPADGTVPTILRLVRYWRDYDLPEELPPVIGKYLTYVSWLNEAHYAVVTVDVRGTGASFGVSTTPWSPEEVSDYGSIVDWILTQPWSNGKIGAVGISYEGVAAAWVAAIQHPAVKAVLPTYSYSDLYADITHPGGIFNDRFMKAWGDITWLMDRNDTSFLAIVGEADPSSLIAQFETLATLVLGGVRPINGDVERREQAAEEHVQNPHVYDATRQIEFRDDLFGTTSVDDVSPLLGATTISRFAAIRRVVGWQDGGTARGALSAFNTLEAEHHVVVITPETHGAGYPVDPYSLLDPQPLDSDDVIEDVWEAVPFFDAFLLDDAIGESRREVVYYTFVEHRWKRSPVWPPEGFEMQRWYFAPDGLLSRDAPTTPDGEDRYTVDFEATTGLQNRWYDALGGPVLYLDRDRQDQRLLVYETPPLEQDLELTGHPVISLQVTSTHTDGAFYAYLEDVSRIGRVVYLTEGQLRAIHRKVSTEQPSAAPFGPYHTFKRADAQTLVPGEVAEITFDLQPISTIIRAGHRIRIAIAGHDKQTFQRYWPEGTPVLTFQRNAQYASWIDLPLKPHTWTLEGTEPPPSVPPLINAICPLISVLGLGVCVVRAVRRPPKPLPDC